METFSTHKFKQLVMKESCDRAHRKEATLFVVRVTTHAVSTALERCRGKESGYCSEVDSGESAALQPDASMHSGALIWSAEASTEESTLTHGQNFIWIKNLIVRIFDYLSQKGSLYYTCTQFYTFPLSNASLPSTGWCLIQHYKIRLFDSRVVYNTMPAKRFHVCSFWIQVVHKMGKAPKVCA